MLKEWRGFELASRYKKISRAYNLEEVTSADDIPLVINTPCYFGYGNHPMPSDYWTNPASMVKFQEDGFLKHLNAVKDDTVPFFMPWFGTGVLVSAFGCLTKPATGRGDDPGIISKCINNPADIARMKQPDPYQDATISVDRDPFETVSRIVQTIRTCVQKKLQGKSLLEGSGS
jgi:hypothetical protein